ncbi:U-box domain-containing protein 27-like [Rutidosis leptorrhynchoides]|uniref:U-box domain-containing protein 27-like n=1 Tax=Rutidosis leptorrhynchoides TaxID=125765 RepID=UPI003A9912A4
MVRDDLYISIPSLFRCPISLDVMKSPVSLCTGVTYDRASIERWLDGGNNTCPATMQVLQSKDFVPNKTLQRLIQIWYDSVRVDSADSVSVVSKERVRCLIEEMKSKGENWWELLEIIVRFARESEENRVFLAKSDGFVDVIIDFLCNCIAVDVRLEIVVVALSLVLSKMEEDRERLSNSMLKSTIPNRDCLAPLLNILRNGSEESIISSIRTLEFIAFDSESKLIIAEKEELIRELIKFVNESTNTQLIESSISCLISLSKPKRTKSKFVHHKLIPGLRKLLEVQNSNIPVTEKALKLLETMSTVKEGRAEISQDSSCVKAVLQKLMKVSGNATEYSVTILWSLCYLFRDEKAQEVVTKNNGLTKILVLMQSNCRPAVRQMCTDLLKVFRVNSKSCLSSYDTKTTHIMPF